MATNNATMAKNKPEYCLHCDSPIVTATEQQCICFRNPRIKCQDYNCNCQKKKCADCGITDQPGCWCAACPYCTMRRLSYVSRSSPLKEERVEEKRVIKTEEKGGNSAAVTNKKSRYCIHCDSPIIPETEECCVCFCHPRVKCEKNNANNDDECNCYKKKCTGCGITEGICLECQTCIINNCPKKGGKDEVFCPSCGQAYINIKRSHSPPPA
ncbi:hypothetical protein B0H63DRAFT_445308 [Podospora didyma]|uniref:Uncharacterized protein n=1 Tax=Podospora didyma TaxID=330526 RepID=A0AAE0P8I2_9PEZI|nr:hypothetical protein B0H63DRAFT_445308 [Podospora didyma]